MSLDEKIIDEELAAKVTPELRDAVAAKAVDGKVTCQEMLDLAEELGVDPALVGTAADVAHIKLHQCKLRCF